MMKPYFTPKMLDKKDYFGAGRTLVAFYRNEMEYVKQIGALQNLSEFYGKKLEIHLGDWHYLDNFFDRFGFRGTPFYLLLSNGAEKGRFFGHAEVNDLRRLVEGDDRSACENA